MAHTDSFSLLANRVAEAKFVWRFMGGAETFTTEQLEGETCGRWYLRQLPGTANFTAGPMLAFLSGNLCYQIEHHLFPDLPSNRYPEITERVRALCDNTT